MKLPNDFVHHEGTGRPQCWLRDGVLDTAYVYQDQYTARDLRRLARWCIEAAEYIECVLKQEDTKNTGKAQKGVK